MTAEQLKILLQTPFCLLLLMFAASFSNGLKQVATTNKAGGSVLLREYFLVHWPDTVAMIIANLIAFAILILTDQLNFASALGVGYGANSVVDLLPGARSSVIATSAVQPKDSP